MFPKGTPGPEDPGDSRQSGVGTDRPQARGQQVWNPMALMQASQDPSVTRRMGLLELGDMPNEARRDPSRTQPCCADAGQEPSRWLPLRGAATSAAANMRAELAWS